MAILNILNIFSQDYTTYQGDRSDMVELNLSKHKLLVLRCMPVPRGLKIAMIGDSGWMLIKSSKL